MRRASRREFLKSSVTVGCAARLGGGLSDYIAADIHSGHAIPTPASPAAPLPIKKGVLLGMLPENLAYADRFKLARAAGSERSAARDRGQLHGRAVAPD